MVEEEEVLIEVEAVQAVYGDDCVVLDSFPPHLHVHIKPRTADISSQQFVEAVIGIRACSQYPKEPPSIDFIESKGLDEERQKELIKSIQDKACELSSCLMLVALCEEAVEKLSIMNHPDGNCPLCLYPLLLEDEQNETLPFMKLMSCFHCFHCECIMNWWNWIQKEKQSDINISSTTTLHSIRDGENQNGMFGSKLKRSDRTEIEDEKLLESDSEKIRRQKFEAILNLQQENSGIIEPKREIVVLPGMYLAQPVTLPAQTLNKETTEEQQRKVSVDSGGSSNRPSSSEHRNLGWRKQRIQNSRKQVKQWVRKDGGPSN